MRKIAYVFALISFWVFVLFALFLALFVVMDLC